MAKSYVPAAPDEKFDRWYAEYPKKQAKGDARKAWEQTAAIRPDLESMLTTLRQQVRSSDWMRDGGQYIPLPASYLRAERWDDVIAVELPKPERKLDRYELANMEQERREAEWKARQALQKAAA